MMIPRYAPTYTFSDLLRSLNISLRENVNDELCSRLATLYKVKHVFLVDSARVALYVLLKAYNRPGGVLMPAYNCIVVPEAVHYAGYHPIFVDIDLSSLNITAEVLKKSLSSDVTVILATHLLGIPCDVEEIKRVLGQYEALIVEDAAPALGAEFGGRPVGSFGDAAIISFQSTKVISGENGGALLTNNDELAHKVSSVLETAISSVGCEYSFAKAFIRKMVTRPRIYPVVQYGYRVLRNEQMYELVPPHTKFPPGFLRLCPRFSSVLVLTQLDRLDWNLKRRRKLAHIYQDGLSEQCCFQLPVMPENSSPAWIQFSILVDEKRKFYKYMQQNGVDLSWTYRYSCADSFGLDGFPNAQKAAKTLVGLPTYPTLTDEQAQYICHVAKNYPAES